MIIKCTEKEKDILVEEICVQHFNKKIECGLYEDCEKCIKANIKIEIVEDKINE